MLEISELDKQFSLLEKTMDILFVKLCGEKVDNDIKAFMMSYIIKNQINDSDIKGLYDSLKREKKIKKLLNRSL
jgi:hypothetical protein